MGATVESLSNTDDVVAAVDELETTRVERKQTLAELDETRDQLETAPEPDHVLDEGAKHEPEGVDGYEMTQTRRVGSIALPVDGEGSIRFAKPSGRAGMEMLNVFDEMEQSGMGLFDQVEYAWATLDEWSLEDEHDVDYWSNSVGTMDAIQLCRNVALGGNGPQR